MCQVRYRHEHPLALFGQRRQRPTDLENSVSQPHKRGRILRCHHPQDGTIWIFHSSCPFVVFPRPPERVVKGGRRNSRIVSGDIYSTVDAVPLATSAFGAALQITHHRRPGTPIVVEGDPLASGRWTIRHDVSNQPTDDTAEHDGYQSCNDNHSSSPSSNVRSQHTWHR